MRTLSLFERGLSSGQVSLGDLLDGNVPDGGDLGRLSVPDAVVALCAGGWPDGIDLAVEDATEANADYLDVIAQVDVERVDGVRRDPELVRRFIASWARNVATAASLATIARLGEDHELAEGTSHAYRRALTRLFLIEDQPAWKPELRSRVRLHATPKRHLADPSLAVAALGATPERLLGPEIEWTGFLFESQVVHDLRVYAEANAATVSFYKDNKALEIDAVVERRDGRWVAVEVKLGHGGVDAGAANLLALAGKVSETARSRCGALVVVTTDTPTYRRDDDVLVTSIGALGP